MSKNGSKGKKLPVAARIVIIILAVVIVAGLAGVLYVNGKLGLIERIKDETRINREDETFEVDPDDENVGEEINPEDVDFNSGDLNVVSDSDVINILFIGSDARKTGQRSRSDSMIICSINRKTNEIKLVSLMRDMYVRIPGYSDNRINASYAFGGMSLLNEVIETNFGIKIDGNVAVDFESFVEALAQVGNLDISLSSTEANYLNNRPEGKTGNWKLKSGVNDLTPEQVLAYSRIRKVGHSDFERTERQRRVIMAAFRKVKGQSLGELIKLAEGILPCIATDMNNAKILDLVRLVATKNMDIGETYRIPINGAYKYATIRKMSVIIPDLSKNSKALQEYIYGSSAQ